MLQGHGDDIYAYGREIRYNFSSNIFGRTDLSGLVAHLSERLECVRAYPEPEPLVLEAQIAERFGLQPDEVCVTNGATEAIYLIAQLFRGMKSYVFQPTFSEYTDACRLHGHTVKSVYSTEAIDEEADIVWLCNPNNPTGEVRTVDKLNELIQSHPSVCFVIDQSYEDFTDKPVFSAIHAASMPQVILLHSATKRFAIPGLRLGYITASAALLQRIRMQRMPWSVNAMAIEAGLYFYNKFRISDIGDLTRDTADDGGSAGSITHLIQETERLRQAIENLKIAEVWPTDTHFFLMRLRFGKSAALKKYLIEEHGILIRDAANFEGLDDTFVRIATQTREENDFLINALATWKTFFLY
ncbi:pyridoxal phosphate-dependent class II aminotransferase [Bacteroides sp. OttesenSCG-928-D19]|nr:pyridoxal phosphate-dependent class II aminotransferase [Bacteroides sp. OttesenSCG-928-D19]